MNLYADTSALMKKYIREHGSDQVLETFAGSAVIGTAAITQVEMASALAKATRLGWIDQEGSNVAWQDFLVHWPAYLRFPMTAGMLEKAARMAWQYGLRANDAVHLASALSWKDLLGEQLVVACFDRSLSAAARQAGLVIWPAAEA